MRLSWVLRAVFCAGLASSARAATITNVSITSLSTGSLSVSWTIPSASTPTIVLSTNNFTNTISSATGSLALAATGYTNLSPNTTYFFQIKNSTEADAEYSSFNAGKATSTLAAVPGASPYTVGSVSTLQANWTSASNGTGVLYEAVISSGIGASTNSFNGNVTSITFNASVLFTGLSVNATYYVDVRAINNNGVATAYQALGSTATLPNDPAAAALSGVATGQITANWTDGGNPAGTRYLAQASTDSAFGAITSASNTTNVMAILIDLTPNTTYFLRVRAVNSSGGSSAIISLGSTSTLAAVPGSASYTTGTVSSLQANWTSAANGAGVRYEAVISTGISPSTNSFTDNQTSATFNTSALFTGLNANTTYYVDVRAINNNGVASAYQALSATATLPNNPVAAALSGVTTAQITANWTDGGNPAGTRYLAQLSVASSFADILASSNTTNVNAILTGGLSPNTTYFIRVRAVNFSGGSSAIVSLGSTSTLAAVPGAVDYSDISTGSLRANWNTASNGAGVTYQAILSSGSSPSTNLFSGNATTVTIDTSFVFTGLTINATYFAEVRAINNNGVVSAFQSLGSTVTIPFGPGAAALSSVGTGQITANWTDGGNPAGTRFLAQASADSGFSGIFASSITLNTFAVVSGLSPNTTYYFQVRALSFLGALSTAAALGSTSTLAAIPGSAAYSGVSTGSLQANWTSSSNGTGVRYEIVLSSGSSPSTNGFPGNQSASTTLTSAVFGSLTLTTTYYAEVRAINNNGLVSGYVSLGSTRTSASSDVLSPGQPQTIVLTSPSGEIRVEIPNQAFDQAVTVSASVPASFAAETVGLKGTGVGVEIIVSPALQPSVGLNLSVSYSDASIAGLDESRLILARYEPTRGVWVPLLSTPDPAANKVLSLVTHLSLFQVMQADPGGDFSRVQAFPNPMHPGRGESAMTFVNLPAGARLRIYTPLGQLLRDITATGAGIASWDGKDSASLPAASGVYVVSIEASGRRGRIKVALER